MNLLPEFNALDLTPPYGLFSFEWYYFAGGGYTLCNDTTLMHIIQNIYYSNRIMRQHF